MKPLLRSAPAPRLPVVEALLLALWMLATIAWRPLLLPDEGRYAGVAFEMLRAGGSLLLPTLDGLPFFHKPPVLYWLDVAAMEVFGVNEFAARCGPALLGWLLAMAMFLHARRWHGAAVARLALVLLATSPLFFVGAQYVNHDIGVAACITAAVLCIVRAVDEPPRVNLRWLLAGWAMCGLGVLAKGLIGIVLPAFVLGPWLLAQGRWRQMLGLLHPLGLLAFAAVVVPWMAAMQSRFPGFFDYFIVEQHFRRFTGTTFNNRMPFWFYAVVLPLFMLPWSGWLVMARPQRLLAAAGTERENSRLAAAPAVARARLGLYLWWTAAIVGFFSLPASKLVGYVLPALAPFALLLALLLHERRTPWPRVAMASALACVAIVGIVAWKAPGSHRELARALAQQHRPGDRVVFVDEYFYDLPFYARLAQPAIVVADWDAPDIGRVDNWRKELYDATRFAADRGASVLWTWSRVPEAACGTRAWIVASSQHHARLAAAIAGLQTRQTVRGVELLLAPARDCAQPSAVPAALPR